MKDVEQHIGKDMNPDHTESLKRKKERLDLMDARGRNDNKDSKQNPIRPESTDGPQFGGITGIKLENDIDEEDLNKP
jgi:hypothetical protein